MRNNEFSRAARKLAKTCIKIYKKLSPDERSTIREYIYKEFYRIELDGSLGVIPNETKM